MPPMSTDKHRFARIEYAPRHRYGRNWPALLTEHGRRDHEDVIWDLSEVTLLDPAAARETNDHADK